MALDEAELGLTTSQQSCWLRAPGRELGEKPKTELDTVVAPADPGAQERVAEGTLSWSGVPG